MSKKTAALLIGFGGPTARSEVRSFLESVLEGTSIPPQRFDEVLHHYEAIGGVSPYNAVTAVQKNALEEWFLARGVALPVGVGYRHSTPAFKDAFEIFKKYGIEKVVAFILASFRCTSSFEKYKLKVAEALRAAGASGIELVYTEPFFDNALYLEAQTDRVREITASFSEEQKHRTFFYFQRIRSPCRCPKKAVMPRNMPLPPKRSHDHSDWLRSSGPRLIKAAAGTPKTRGLDRTSLRHSRL